VVGRTEQSTSRVPTSSRLVVLSFIGAVLLGGGNFVAVRFSNRELDPLWGAGARFAIAASVFACVLLVRRIRLPRRGQLPMLGLYGFLAFGVSYGFLYVGMQEVPAGVAAVVMAAGPLLTLLLARAQRLESLHLGALMGAVVALLGSALMFLQPQETAFGWWRLGAVCLAACSVAQSVVIAKRCGPQHPVVMNAVGMGTGAVVLLVASALRGEDWALPRGSSTILAFGYLVAASVTLFVLVLVVIQRWTASSSSYIFVLMPPVALVLGSTLGGEPVTGATVLGGLVVLTGVYIGVLKGPRARHSTTPDARAT
jgi:drug/metabolite transporter (DMT)-like permease